MFNNQPLNSPNSPEEVETEEIQRESFVFYKSFWEAINQLDPEDQLISLKAICEKALYNKTPDLKGFNKALFIAFSPQIEANIRRREISQKGGAPKGNKNNRYSELPHKSTTKVQPCTTKYNPGCTPVQPNVNDNVNVNANDNVNVNGKENVKTAKKESKQTPALPQRQKDFQEELGPYITKYGDELVRSFYIYWSEKARNGTLMRKEMEKTWETPKRLALWAKKEERYGK